MECTRAQYCYHRYTDKKFLIPNCRLNFVLSFIHFLCYFLGSDDYTLCVWKVNEQTHQTPTEAIAARTVERNSARLLQVNSARTLSLNSNLKVKKKTPSKLKSLLPVSSILDTGGRSSSIHDIKILASQQGIVLNNCNIEESCPSESTHLGLFRDRETSIEMLLGEVQHHQERSNYDLAAHLQTWMGDVESVLKNACKNKQLSDFLIGLAPQVSIEYVTFRSNTILLSL